MKKFAIATSSILAFLLSFSLASAHAIVKPNQVGIGAVQDFTLGVPSEKDAPLSTTAIKLMLPDGLSFVVPYVKPGWTAVVKTEATGNQIKDDDGMMVPEMKPTEIDWTGGSIPAGERDNFVFQAQVSATPTTLAWKTVQTYSDGSTVSWTLGPNDAQPQDSNGNPDFSNYGPYSQTAVVNDLTPSATTAPATSAMSAAGGSSSKTTSNLALGAGILALVLSAFALMRKGS